MAKRDAGGGWPPGGEPPRDRRFLAWLADDAGEAAWHAVEWDPDSVSDVDGDPSRDHKVGVPYSACGWVRGGDILAWAEAPPPPA